MSRFGIATIIAVVALVTVGMFLESPTRWALGGFVVATYIVALGLGVAFTKMQFFCRAACRGKTGRMRVALTFDDGPDPKTTPALLDTLRKYDAPGAFFLIGERALENPELLVRMLDEGHLIGNHTFKHAWWTNFLFGAALRNEIGRAQEAIHSAANIAPKYFRSPMGLTNPHLSGALNEAGLTLVGWDIRAFDRRRAPTEIIARIVKNARDGSIIALHDEGVSASDMIATMTGMIAELRDRGFSLVRLDELFGDSQS